MIYGDGKPKPAGTWDYHGSCAPKNHGCAWNTTFSVGIFEWVPKSGGEGTKRGKVFKRLKGFTRDPHTVYDKAFQICSLKGVDASPA